MEDEQQRNWKERSCGITLTWHLVAKPSQYLFFLLPIVFYKVLIKWEGVLALLHYSVVFYLEHFGYTAELWQICEQYVHNKPLLFLSCTQTHWVMRKIVTTVHVNAIQYNSPVTTLAIFICWWYNDNFEAVIIDVLWLHISVKSSNIFL